jgi:hypothetical protein
MIAPSWLLDRGISRPNQALVAAAEGGGAAAENFNCPFLDQDPSAVPLALRRRYRRVFFSFSSPSLIRRSSE